MESLRRIAPRLRTLNLFYNRFSSSVATLKVERRSTWLYLLLWSCIFAIVLFYNLTTEETTYVTLMEPKESDFVDLTNTHGSAVHCPCSGKMIPYRLVSDRSARLHQVCSSQYTKTPWIESILDSGIRLNLAQADFRTYALGYFLTLRYLCEFAQRTVDMTEWDLASRSISKSGIMSRDELIAQMYYAMNQTNLEKISNFKAVLYTGRGLTHGNQLVSLFSSYWTLPSVDLQQPLGGRVPYQPASGGSNCSCYTSSECTEPVTINGHVVSGFVHGCSALESVLRSSLTCFYDQRCLEQINVGNSTLIKPLNLSIFSRFTPNNTGQDLVENGFQEEWSLSTNYSHFFSICAAHQCDYSISQRKNTVETVTLILGLYGGLTLILRFIVPRFVGIISNTPCIAWFRKDRVLPLQ